MLPEAELGNGIMDKGILQFAEAEEPNEHRAALSPISRGRRHARGTYERGLAKVQERLALLSSVRGLGFWSWNRSTDRVRATKHARDILGLSAKAALTGDTLLAALHPEDRVALVRAIDRTASSREPVEMELRVIGQDQMICCITAKAGAHRGPDGMIRRVSGYVIDDTPRKRAEAELLKQQQQITHLSRVAMMGELSGALAHELQQPLTAILCNAQAGQLIADNGQIGGEELREILREIISDIKHAGEIIHNLRAHLIRGEMQLELLDLMELLREVLILARGKLREHQVKLDARIDPNLPAVIGDRVEIQQVLLNLLLNACESMSTNPPGDRLIEIAAVVDHDVVRTSILDRGRGIDAAQLGRIFEPFFTTKKRGLGLGLSVCRSIIAAHNGRLWATNRADRGAVLNFTLPIAATEISKTPPSACVAST